MLRNHSFVTRRVPRTEHTRRSSENGPRGGNGESTAVRRVPSPARRDGGTPPSPKPRSSVAGRRTRTAARHSWCAPGGDRRRARSRHSRARGERRTRRMRARDGRAIPLDRDAEGLSICTAFLPGDSAVVVSLSASRMSTAPPGSVRSLPLSSHARRRRPPPVQRGHAPAALEESSARMCT
jgi:hypothetical protein